MDEGIAIATAISRAKDWAANRGKETTGQVGRSTDVKKHGEDRYVIPYHGHEWAIKNEGSKRVEKVFSNKNEAVQQARQEARKANASLTIQKRDGRVLQRISYNPNNAPESKYDVIRCTAFRYLPNRDMPSRLNL